MKHVIDQPVGIESGSGRIRKNPTMRTQNQHSIVLERLFGIHAPPIRVDRALGNVELKQHLLHLNNRDLVPADMQGDLGIPINLNYIQVNTKIKSKLQGQFRFGKGSRKGDIYLKLFRLAQQKRVIIQEVVTSGTPEFVIVCY